MDVRNRMADVVKLRCNACQDFLKMIIKQGWQQVLYDKAKDEVDNNGRYKDKYIAVYEKMRDIGIDNYRVDDMDVTFISEILHRCSNIAFVQKRTKNAMQQLTEDRNLTNHSSENEEPEELYLRGLLSLCNLKNFVRTIDKYELSISDVDRLEYRKKYLAKIEELKDLLDEECIVLVQKNKDIDRDIQTILESKDILNTWCDISKLYMDRYWKLEKDYDRYNEFMLRASDAGIAQAHSHAAEYFFLVRKDYEEAEKRLYMMYSVSEKSDVYTMKTIIDMINIYLMGENTITDGMKQLVEKVVENGYPIEQTAEGLYQWKKSK